MDRAATLAHEGGALAGFRFSPVDRGQYLSGSSRKNELYIAKYISFFQSQVRAPDLAHTGVAAPPAASEPHCRWACVALAMGALLPQLGYDFGAANMLLELVRDNRRVLDRISEQQVESFIFWLKKSGDPAFLNFLNVLCVCNKVYGGRRPPTGEKTVLCDSAHPGVASPSRSRARACGPSARCPSRSSLCSKTCSAKTRRCLCCTSLR